MDPIRDFYRKIWEEYADPGSHPITARGLAAQARTVQARIGAERPQRVLDLGCGPVPVIGPRWAPRVIRADILLEMLLRLTTEESCPSVCLDARRLPFRTGSFQLIWCSLLVDHISPVGPWIDELGRVLAPSGTLGLACWQQSRLPGERYPDRKMRYTTTAGAELTVPSYPNWEEALRILKDRDPSLEVESHPIVPDEYVLQVAWARLRT
jgi:SAM-dependent methyltransferase